MLRFKRAARKIDEGRIYDGSALFLSIWTQFCLKEEA